MGTVLRDQTHSDMVRNAKAGSCCVKIFSLTLGQHPLGRFQWSHRQAFGPELLVVELSLLLGAAPHHSRPF
jgi:hypothetical protein